MLHRPSLPARALLPVLLAGIASPVAAAPFTLLIYEDPGQFALRPQTNDAAADYWAAYATYGEELAAAGVLRGGSALSTGAPVGLVSGGLATTATSPYASSPLSLGGYFQIDVASEAEALEWARRLPVEGSGTVEVRAGYPIPAPNAM